MQYTTPFVYYGMFSNIILAVVYARVTCISDRCRSCCLRTVL